eukprot:5345306-Pleurochrysis_carterae.AAC.1
MRWQSREHDRRSARHGEKRGRCLSGGRQHRWMRLVVVAPQMRRRRVLCHATGSLFHRNTHRM